MRIEKDTELDFKNVVPSRLDLKSRICLMAAIIFGTSDQEKVSPEKSVQFAFEIENYADAAVKKVKRDRPIIPRAVRREPTNVA